MTQKVKFGCTLRHTYIVHLSINFQIPYWKKLFDVSQRQLLYRFNDLITLKIVISLIRIPLIATYGVKLLRTFFDHSIHRLCFNPSWFPIMCILAILSISIPIRVLRICNLLQEIVTCLAASK